MTPKELGKLLTSGGQVLKTRDDSAPVALERKADPPGADPFTLHAEGSVPNSVEKESGVTSC